MIENWELIGHDWAVNMLSRRLAAGSASHAYLITGLESVGKSLLALRLAQAVNCETDHPPCLECRTCDLIGRGQYADVIIVEADGSSIKIEAIREIQAFIALRPFEARYRVAIIQDADRATGSAMDAMLKTLEEPPPTGKLILTSSNSGALLDTIVSRCQVIPLRPVPVATIDTALQAGFQIDAARAELIARLSGGRPGWAIATASDPESLAQRAEILEHLLVALQAGRVGRFSYAETIARADNRAQILNAWQTWWRDVLLVAQRSETLPVNLDRRAELEAVAAQVGSDQASAALQTVWDTISLIENTNTNVRLALEVMLLDMPYLTA